MAGRLVQKVQNWFENSNRKKFYIVYTVLFLFLIFLCLSWFIFTNSSLIWSYDGWNQHFKALVYYATYLRSIIINLIFEHKIVIPDWDFNIGEGSDIVNALHYYVIGDPIALLSVFVPSRYMQYFYSFSSVLRLYLAGLSFIYLCFNTGIQNRYGIMAGALSYVFSMWGLFNVARHPYFLNPMIYLPLIIVGIEKILKEDKPFLFIIAVAISAISNFYFFYIIVIITIVYTIIRLTLIYKNNLKKGFVILVKIGINSLIGVCIASVILLPVMMMFLRDSRLQTSLPFRLFYWLGYYSKLPSMFISNSKDYWVTVGFTAPVILSIPVLYSNKGNHKILKYLFFLSIIILIFPFGGRILNGMSYATNRWIFAFILLCAYILTIKWEQLLSLSKKQWLILFVFSSIYFVVCLYFEKSHNGEVMSAFALFFVTLFVLRRNNKDEYQKVLSQLMVLGIIMYGVFNISYWQYAPSAGNYIINYIKNNEVWDKWNNNEIASLQKITKDSFTRYSGNCITDNINMSLGMSNTQYYWSISNPYVNNYRANLEMREESFFNYMGYDERTTPIVLSSTQYYVTREDNDVVPYGFKLVKIDNANEENTKRKLEEIKDVLGVKELTQEQIETVEESIGNVYKVYKNKNTLPLGYCYDRIISLDRWNELNPVQKQESMLNAAVVSDDSINLLKYDDFSNDYLVAYELTCNDKNISYINSNIVTTTDKVSATITILEKIGNSELYIEFKGLEFIATPEYDLYFCEEDVDPLNLYSKANWDVLSQKEKNAIYKEKKDWNSISNIELKIKSSNGTEKYMIYRQPEAEFSSGRHDFIVNLGYTKEGIEKITITFPKRGIYKFKSINVYGISMEGYEENIEKLKENSLQNIRFKTDNVYGDITVDSSKVLCVAIPYSFGWEGFVDGEKTEVFCINDHYLGMMIPSGLHSIKLHYRTPYKITGLLISIMGIMVLITMMITDYFKRKTLKDNENIYKMIPYSDRKDKMNSLR